MLSSDIKTTSHIYKAIEFKKKKCLNRASTKNGINTQNKCQI